MGAFRNFNPVKLHFLLYCWTKIFSPKKYRELVIFLWHSPIYIKVHLWCTNQSVVFEIILIETLLFFFKGQLSLLMMMIARIPPEIVLFEWNALVTFLLIVFRKSHSIFVDQFKVSFNWKFNWTSINCTTLINQQLF